MIREAPVFIDCDKCHCLAVIKLSEALQEEPVAGLKGWAIDWSTPEGRCLCPECVAKR